MTGIFFILLKSPGMASDPAALGTLNHLGIAFFLVSIGLLILLSAHYYRMKGGVERKRKFKDKHSKIENDPVMQLQFMSREELKAMVMKERAKNPDGETGASALSAQRASTIKTFDDWIAISPENTKRETSSQQMLFPETGLEPDPVTESPFSPKNDAEPAKKVTPPTDTEILANLVIPKDIDADEKKDPEKSPFGDKVTRSALSNELPEEFRRKSRKV